MLEDLGALGGTFVNGLRVARHVQVGPDDEILIGPCRLKVAPAREGGSNAAVPAAPLPLSPPVREAAAAPLPVSSLPSLQWRRRLHAALLGALDPVSYTHLRQPMAMPSIPAR